MADRSNLTAIQQARAAVLVNALLRQAEDDAAVSEATKRAATITPADAEMLLKLTEEELAAQGWTKSDLIIAIDARTAKSQVPFYLQAAHERHVTRIRAANGASAGKPSEAAYAVIPVAADEEPARDVAQLGEADEE